MYDYVRCDLSVHNVEIYQIHYKDVSRAFPIKIINIKSCTTHGVHITFQGQSRKIRRGWKSREMSTDLYANWLVLPPGSSILLKKGIALIRSNAAFSLYGKIDDLFWTSSCSDKLRLDDLWLHNPDSNVFINFVSYQYSLSWTLHKWISLDSNTSNHTLYIYKTPTSMKVMPFVYI